MDLAIVLILAGGIVFLWLYLWSRQRQQLGYIHNEQQVEQSLQNTPFAAQNNNSAVLVASEHGQLLYANDMARRWLGFDMGLPDLERIARRTQPAESFLNLFAAEGHASLQVGSRWVEAFSHYIPAEGERRLVVVMRDASQVVRSDTTVDLSKAMALVAEIDETVNASMGVEQVLQTLLTIISKELPVEAGEICLWDEEQKLLHQRGWIGNAMYLLEMSASGGGVYRVGEGVTGWVARYRQPLIIGDPDHPAAVRPKVESLPFKSILAIPLMLGETFIGTFELFRLEPNAFKQSDLALLEALSRPVSVAIYNAILYTHQV
ncbi:MAG: GAF domain-containing protein, partial [Chloroflexi bacterium]